MTQTSILRRTSIFGFLMVMVMVTAVMLSPCATARAAESVAAHAHVSMLRIARAIAMPDTVANAVVYTKDSAILVEPSNVVRQDSDSLSVPDSTAVPFTDSAQIATPKYSYPDSIYPIDGHITARLPILDSLLRTTHWHTDLVTRFSKLVPIDSSLLYAHLYDPTLDGPHLKTNLGIDYAVTIDDAFSARPNATSPTPLFANALINLFPLASGVDSYSARGPFSQVVLMSNFSSRTEQLDGRIFYTQNVNPSTNLGLAFNHGDETSAYQNFESRVNAIRAFGSYAANRLYLNLSLGFAKHSLKDYGGLAHDDDQLNPDLKRQETEVRLTTPMARTSSQAASAIFEYDLIQHRNMVRDSLGIQYTSHVPLLSLTSTHHFRAYYRSFNETYNEQERRPRYLSHAAAHDSVGQQTYTATIGARLHQLKHAHISLPGLRAAVGYQLDRYIQQRPDQYLTGQLGTLTHSLFIEAAADYTHPYFTVQAYAKSYLLGAQLGNTYLQAEASYFPAKQERQYEINASWQGGYAQQHPFYLYYRSNRFMWDNNGLFHRSFSSTLHAAFIAPKWGGEYGVNNSTISNYTYLDDSAHPAQLPALNVLEAYVQQTFDRWGLSIILRGSWQHASHVAAAVPTVTAYGNLAYHFQVIKDALHVRIGMEAYYRTLFFAPGYCSDLGVFYAQRTMQIGNYPMLNAFLSLKWKSANIFVRVYNVTQGAFGYDFFAAPHYPDRRRSVRLGINWYLYN